MSRKVIVGELDNNRSIRKGGHKDVPLTMIEVICYNHYSNRFTVGEIYIASINLSKTTYQIENDYDATVCIPVKRFFEHFKEAELVWKR